MSTAKSIFCNAAKIIKLINGMDETINLLIF